MSSPQNDVDVHRDLIIDIYSKAYDRAGAYTNLIMLGGYAGCFAIWNFTREHLTARASAWVALLLLSSLTAFILFEVYKMVFNTRHGTIIAAILQKQSPSAQIVAEVREHEKKLARENLLVLHRIWAAALAVSLGTALIAVAILIWNFVAIILGAS